MYYSKVIFMLLVACWSCSITVSGVLAPKGPLRSHITGGYKKIQTRSSRSDLDCTQFNSDYDVLYHFSFQIMINPMNSDWYKSTAIMDDEDTLVINLSVIEENAVPLSIFCLQNLRYLTIQSTPFPDGIVPDTLENLKNLIQLNIDNSPIMNMTERLGKLSSLYFLTLTNCLLTYLPDLSGIPYLPYVVLRGNRLSKVDGLNDVNNLYLDSNLFTDIPTLNRPGALYSLSMYDNPLKNMLKITSHVTLTWLNLGNTNLSSIPATIDRLQSLEYLMLFNNKLFYLPTNMLKLTTLRELDIRNNLFSYDDVQMFRTQFNQSNPNMTLLA